MGKHSQAKHRWPKREREAHTFSDRVADQFGHIFRILSRGLRRPEKEELKKRLEEQGR